MSLKLASTQLEKLQGLLVAHMNVAAARGILVEVSALAQRYRKRLNLRPRTHSPGKAWSASCFLFSKTRSGTLKRCPIKIMTA